MALARRWEADGGGSLGEFLDTVVLSEEDAWRPRGDPGARPHAARGEGARVRHRGHRGRRGGAPAPLPAHRPRGARRGAAPLLRGHDPGAAAARALRRPHAAPLGRCRVPAALPLPPRGRARHPAGLRRAPSPPHHWRSVRHEPDRAPRPTAERLPRVSPSRLEAWDRCPAAYRFEYVLRLPQPVADQRPRLLGSVAHALVEAYVREAQATGTPPPARSAPGPGTGTREPARAAGRATTAGLAREATALVSAWLSRWAVPLAHTVGVEHALAIDAGGRRVAWDAPDAFLRGRLDLVAVEGRQATVCDWKSGWLTEDDESLRVGVGAGLLRGAALGVGAAARGGHRRVPLPAHRPGRPRDLRPGGRRRDAGLGADDRGPHRRGPRPPRTIPPPSRPGPRPPAPPAPG